MNDHNSSYIYSIIIIILLLYQSRQRGTLTFDVSTPYLMAPISLNFFESIIYISISWKNPMWS